MSRIVKLMLVLALLTSVVASVSAQEGEDGDIVTITVGTDATYPPFEVLNEDGEFEGFDIDLFRAIAEDAGFEVEFVNAGFSTIFVALSEGEFDAVISASTITEEREEIIDFSDPYFNAGQVISVSADLVGEIESPEDLPGRRVGVQLGTTGDQYATEIEGIQVERYEDINQAFQALAIGELEAIIADGPTSADIIANNPDYNAVIVGEPLTDEFYGIAVDPAQPELLDAINLSLENIIADGTYAEIYTEWFGSEPPAEFMPGGDEMAMEVDFTDPASVTLGLVDTFFGAESPEDLLAFACEGAAESPLFPDEAGLAAFEGIELGSIENLVLDVVVEDGVATVTPTGELTLVIGGAETTFPADVLLGQLGIESIRLEQGEDGNWLVCPE